MQNSDVIRLFGQNKLYSDVTPYYAAANLGQMTGFSDKNKFIWKISDQGH